MRTNGNSNGNDKYLFVKCICITLLLAGLTILGIAPVIAASCSFINITQGEQGIQGIPGVNGTNGSNGVAGANGTAATIQIGSVTSGTPASVTNVGTTLDAIFNFVLPKGDKGDKGDTGSSGYTPIFGVDYFNGSTGATGAQGIQGIQGIPGTNGTNGSDGDDGAAATINVNATFTLSPGSSATVTNIGTQAAALFNFGIPAGATGAQGIQGIQGETGATGPMNQTPGPQGEQGLQGIQGIPGVNGTTPVFGVDYFNGSTGATGATGPAGANGTAATIAINYTGTLSPGSPATVTNIGTELAALLNFGIPAGATGAQGIQGIQGETGPTGPMNQTPGPQGIQGETGPQGEPGTIPDVTQFLFINGTRAMTGNLSMGSQYITGLHDPSITTDAATMGWVLGKNYWAGTNYNASYWTGTNYNSTYDSKPSSTYNSSYDPLIRSDYVYTGNGSYLLGSNTSIATTTYVGQVNTSMKNYVDSGLPYVSSTNSSLVLISNTTYALDSEVTAVNTSMKNYVDARPDSTYNASYWTGTNYNSSYITSTYNATYDAKANSAVYGYMSLMAGSAMITTTNPATMTQAETSTNKNNYITVDFTDGGSEVAQWIVDFPADWNYSANVVFTPVWTATSGSGTFNATIKAKLFPDDAALDTALATVGTSVDTLTATGDVMVSPATTGAAISSVGTGGNTAIVQVSRDSTADTLSGTARLIALRIKYARILA